MLTREQWIAGLEPGDIVCDCTRTHREIVRIEDEIEPENDILAVSTWMIALFSPAVAKAFQERVLKVARGTVAERIVYFADGSRCYASRCLDPAANCLHD